MIFKTKQQIHFTNICIRFHSQINNNLKLQIDSRLAIVNFQTHKPPILQFQPKNAANLQTPIANSDMQQN